MIKEKRANFDFLSAKTGGDLCRIKIRGVEGGISDKRGTEKFRKETIVSYSGQSTGICLDVL